MKEIFISHASKDEPLATRLVEDLLINGCDVTGNRILCTSMEGLGIPAGTESFIDFLKRKLTGTKLVILLLSENYFDSAFCLCELGATWGLGKNTFPLIIPPINKSDLPATLKVTQGRDILNSASLDELCNRVSEALKTAPSIGRWNLKKRQFLESLPNILGVLPKPAKIKHSKLEEVNLTLNAAISELDEKSERITELESEISELRKHVAPEMARQVSKQFTTKSQHFDSLCKDVINSFKKINHATITTLYFSMRSEGFFPKSNDEWSNIADAIHLQEIVTFDEVRYDPNSSHPRTRRASEALEEIGRFISDEEFNESTFASDFEEENDYPLDVRNIELWQEKFGAYP